MLEIVFNSKIMFALDLSKLSQTSIFYLEEFPPFSNQSLFIGVIRVSIYLNFPYTTTILIIRVCIRVGD